ncbi:MAG: hypothetical protein CMM07_02725 [Rhodopirellula sp.]|nr:hypothetical protein [Rhodopirellula sp.]
MSQICLFTWQAEMPELGAAIPEVTTKAKDKNALKGNSADESRLLERGSQIYTQSCQSCHGESGQGSEDGYDHALTGDLSVGSLTQLISRTMPEEDADACVGEDAAAVATYIHASFYSEAARARNRPPRIAMSRLTGQQLRQSIADLYGHFTQPPRTSDQRGVKAAYYKGTSRKSEELQIERVDHAIDFDFGTEPPGEGIDPKSYLIHWEGSLKVDKTGRYQIVLRSTCSCMMEFGSRKRELINNHVQSEGRDEFRREIFLTAGRAYPFEISFLQRKRKTKQPPARVSLSWIPPGGIEEVIPQENLIPEQLADTFALQAKLPPDDRSYGYDRGTSVSRQWDESTTATAIEFAEITIAELYPKYRHRYRGEADENRSILKRFLAEIITVAFRGKLDDAARHLYIDQQIAFSEDDGEAIRRAMLMALKSPRFLYPTLDSEHNQSQRTANRLALIMFDSLPSDPWLINAAAKDKLQNETQLTNAARRMVDDYRTQAKALTFLNEWLGLQHTDDIAKDSELFPGFDPHTIQDLKKSMNRFLQDFIESKTSDFRQLLQADWRYTTKRLENYYGAAWRPDMPPGQRQVRATQGAELPSPEDAKGETDETTDAPHDDGQIDSMLIRSVRDQQIHAGVLTHPLIMSNLAYHRTTSPIHRGVFLTRRTLGRVLRPPDASFTPLSADLHPELTTRERVQLQTGEANCQTCHQQINSLGFALENFDATGRFRRKEKAKPINAAGHYTDRSGKQIKFNNARELADYLAQSEDCHHAFIEAAFEHFVKQPITAYGSGTADKITKSFRDSGYNVRELLITIAVTASRQPAAIQPLP